MMGSQPANNPISMNTSIVFPASEPVLKLSRPSAEKWAAALLEERRRLLEDQDALREREQNLRNYEARLRALQEEIETGRGLATHATSDSMASFPTRQMSRPPFGNETDLATAWAKLHRARELFEVEQSHLREDRHAIREQEVVLKRREATVAVREAQLAERETNAAGETPGSDEPVAGEHSMSAVTRLTRMPFDMARSVFGGRK